ncbi:GIY-YIG nuclease family protein [Blautia hydrogenotrophica]|uniref:GIY-YIG domain-containing protein n=1 Tax=Blautia hydrogenotrophica (strain DSM 10507 / JCM 14656 / S5a33) TaxID=476272 RepID=C0CR41_BLAHS|nr:GIY-YIG nuclease family protein [Blautia hydrogenotrophica]SCI34633.1 group I intron endonuclease [uncultured Blautia sp.]EEG47804.1 GIY-YIG catalytic domain protein [Blautia hydrogenotrophica DSM 10507]MCT6798129.1 GIY-YIG nuclease family protein [Blautia hydrogenotrophica]WPX84184.1 hypothetical protein BLHYD_21940 [Blautia hydrogenotrophica DSM 10507]CUM76844.1 group I intron endonuclease [Blautia hydrogenotrophica]
MSQARKNIARVKSIQRQNIQRLKKLNPDIDSKSGIYFLTRNEPQIYIGQARHLDERLASHLSGYEQHIDRSLKAHGLYSEDNPYGYKVNFLHYPKSKLDEMEQYYIQLYAEKGWALKNKTAGSQGVGKVKIADFKPAKGYMDGLKQGRKNLAKELSHIIDKHLTVQLREDKQNNKVSQKALEKFNRLLDERSYEE